MCVCVYMLSAALLVAAAAFVPHTQPPCSRRHAAVVAMAKGFSKAPPPASKPPKKRAAAAGPAPPPPLSAKAQQASKDFDSLKASGAPEYSIAVRTVSSGGEPSEWYLVGGLAVPRSNSEEKAVSMAIFQNEDELLKGAYRSYPKLKVENAILAGCGWRWLSSQGSAGLPDLTHCSAAHRCR